MKNTKKIVSVSFLIDGILLSVVVAVGWFLIGYYMKGEYLYVNYQDWIYHAWRIKILDAYNGMPSWDNIWSNGLNHWRAYQYTQHWIILYISKIFHLTITKAMLLVTVLVFIVSRVAMYVVLRNLKVKPIIAFLGVIISFAYVQQWIAISDFSIFIALLVVPFYAYIWINVLEKYQLSFGANLKKRTIAECGFALFAGSLWMLHPVVANALGGLFFVSIGFRALKIHKMYFMKVFFFYLLGAAPFFLPYLLSGYHTANPIFTSPVFLKDTIAGDFFGMSMYFISFIGALWIMMILMFRRVPAWAKGITVYSTLYMFLIYLAQQNYIPKIILQLQISRVIPVLVLLLAMAFAGALNGVIMVNKKIILSRGLVSILLIISVIGITESIKIATAFTGQPVYELDDPVALYFNDRPIPKGSIYVKNVSSASYFGKTGLRFVNSYNEHLLPHPLSMRFSSFMRSEIAYTGIPKAQVQLINDYALVLGVEYLVLPESSPLVERLTKGNVNDNSSEATFEFVENVYSNQGIFSILHNKKDINYVYLVDKNDQILQWSKEIAQPTLQVSSYTQWDDGIHDLAEKIRSNEVVALADINFTKPDKMFIPVVSSSVEDNKNILITQSYDKGWKILGKHKGIEPSQMRFIVVNPQQIISGDSARLDDGTEGIMLYNQWPLWHWPLQAFGLVIFLSAIVVIIVRPRIFFLK